VGTISVTSIEVAPPLDSKKTGVLHTAWTAWTYGPHLIGLPAPGVGPARPPEVRRRAKRACILFETIPGDPNEITRIRSR